ncbi:MAG: hypothetical protein ACI9OJ_005643, partial [Myxococcota bacterium]
PDKAPTALYELKAALGSIKFTGRTATLARSANLTLTSALAAVGELPVIIEIVPTIAGNKITRARRFRASYRAANVARALRQLKVPRDRIRVAPAELTGDTVPLGPVDLRLVTIQAPVEPK